MFPTSISKQRVPELDGLRGLAILLVLVFHFIGQEGVLPHGSLGDCLQRLVVMGWTGVDLFFVLSGFLIGGILMDVRRSPSFFSTFYARRFFRIVPVYYLWIFLYIALVAAAGASVTRLSNSGIRPPLDFRIFSHFLFLQNLVPISLFGLAGAWFGHLWSLAVEEQFYLLAPLAVRFSGGKVLKWLLFATIAFVPLLRIAALRVWHIPPLYAHVLVICRADALAIGMLAATLTRGDHPVFSGSASRSKLRVLLGILALGVFGLWVVSPQANTFGMQWGNGEMGNGGQTGRFPI
jgi:peptidoglycan/LPS O-acetylase OafA/YrhL